MRGFVVKRAVAAADKPAHDMSAERRAFVEAHGPRAAGWLVWTHRKQFHNAGAVDFKAPVKTNKVTGAKLRYFFAAMDLLRTRAGWSVDVITHKKERTFRVKWLGWKSWIRPASLS